jgi:hypothetical protein
VSDLQAVSRRTLLRTGLLLPLVATAACTEAGSPPDRPFEPHPDVVLADAAAARERSLLAAYDAALGLAPALAERLAPLRAEHAEHLAALDVPQLPTPSTEPSATPTPAPVLPADPPALLVALAGLERSAATAHADACVRAGRGLAVVLASAAASEASHPVALG